MEGLFSGSRREVNGSFTLAGFGVFRPLQGEWIYHVIQGFLYVPPGQSLPGFWAYSNHFSWVWFNQLAGGEYFYSFEFGSLVFMHRVSDEAGFYYVYSGFNQGWHYLGK